MLRLTPLVASFSLVAYVAAIGIDCEQAVAIAVPARAAQAAQAARLAAKPPAAPGPWAMHHGQDRAGHVRGHSHAGRLAHGAAHAGSVSHHAAHPPGGHGLADRHGLGPRDPESGESPPRGLVKTTDSSPLALVPTCLCGCSKNRSRVGGPASRLGAVVPGVVLTRLPEASRERGFAPWTPRLVGLFAARDPIPI